MESKHTEFKNTYSVQNDIEVKNNESSQHANFSSLHNPYDLNHIHGLRNRLFKTFNVFATILENALLPPVLKSTKKIKIKIKECDELNTNYMVKINSMLSDIKRESTNENLNSTKNKTNVMLRKSFQIKLIQCYKLTINATELCSKTLEANIYNPIQSKMKNLIKSISVLSFITGKYIYGALFKKKKEESFDLVQRCKDLNRMLDACGYKDNQNDDQDFNLLNKLANKTLAKPKTQFLNSNSNRFSMYSHSKPKLGTTYAKGWSKKSLDSTKIQDMNSEHYCNSDIINENQMLLKKNIHFRSSNTLNNYNSDNIMTLIQEHPSEKLDINITNNVQGSKSIENKRFIEYSDDVTNSPISSKLKLNKLKTPNNVKLFIVKENVWRKFPIKNICLSQDGSLRLYINPEQIQNNYLYKKQFRQLSLATESNMDTLSDITELIMEHLLNEVLSKIVNNTCNRLIQMELF